MNDIGELVITIFVLVLEIRHGDLGRLVRDVVVVFVLVGALEKLGLLNVQVGDVQLYHFLKLFVLEDQDAVYGPVDRLREDHHSRNAEVVHPAEVQKLIFLLDLEFHELLSLLLDLLLLRKYLPHSEIPDRRYYEVLQFSRVEVESEVRALDDRFECRFSYVFLLLVKPKAQDRLALT